MVLSLVVRVRKKVSRFATFTGASERCAPLYSFGMDPPLDVSPIRPAMLSFYHISLAFDRPTGSCAMDWITNG